MKSGVVVPVHKGSGEDPLQANSYRGVTLSSVVSLLERLESVFQEVKIPHPNSQEGIMCWCHSDYSRSYVEIPKKWEQGFHVPLWPSKSIWTSCFAWESCTMWGEWEMFATDQKLIWGDSVKSSRRVGYYLSSTLWRGGSVLSTAPASHGPPTDSLSEIKCESLYQQLLCGWISTC